MNWRNGVLLVALTLVSAFGPSAAAQVRDQLLSMLDEAAAMVDVNSLTPVSLSDMQPVRKIEPNGLLPAAFAAKAIAETPAPVMTEPNSTPEEEQARQLRQEVLLSRIEPVQTLSYEQQQRNLDRLIAQLNSLEPPRQNTTTISAQSQSQEKAADEAQADGSATPDEALAQADPNSTVCADPNTAANSLVARLKSADSLVDPLLLADALFRSGLQEEAYGYYQLASASLQQTENAQWALFQMANCSRYVDPAKAREHYSELLSRFPNCLWNASAKSRLATLEWTTNESLKPYVTASLNARQQ